LDKKIEKELQKVQQEVSHLKSKNFESEKDGPSSRRRCDEGIQISQN